MSTKDAAYHREAQTPGRLPPDEATTRLGWRPGPPEIRSWMRRHKLLASKATAGIGIAALAGIPACGGNAPQRPSAPPSSYANANQVVQELRAHHVLVTNVVPEGASEFWSGEGATSGVWATTAPGDSAAVFGGSLNPVQDTEIVVFQNHANAVAYVNVSADPNASPDPDHESILGTNWAVDAATPAAPKIRAVLGGTLMPNVPASSAPASPAGSAPATGASATDVQICNDLNTWEASNDGMAASNFGTDSASEAIVQEASGSSAVDQDVQNLSADSGSQASSDLASLAADCAAAGVTLTGSDFAPATSSSPAAPPPTTPAAPTTLLTQSGSGSYTSSQFTVGGSGDYKVYWTYSEGSFGQSVNFQLWEDGGADFNFTDPNQLGTGGSGVVNVYNDPGTHTLTVNSEGSWTVKVVTAP